MMPRYIVITCYVCGNQERVTDKTQTKCFDCREATERASVMQVVQQAKELGIATEKGD